MMASNIDPTKPAGPIAYTADVRDNFAAAADEISALQAAGPFLPIDGSVPMTGPLNAPTMIVQPGWSCCFATNLYPTDDQGSFNYLQDGFAAFLQQDPDFGGVNLTLFPNAAADTSISYAAGNFSFGQDGSFAANGIWGTVDRALGLYDDGSGNRWMQFNPGWGWMYSMPNGGPLSWLVNGNPVFSIDNAGNVAVVGTLSLPIDATNPTDALNLQSGDARYAPIALADDVAALRAEFLTLRGSAR